MGKIKSFYSYYLSKDHDLVGFWEKNKNHKEISKTLKKILVYFYTQKVMNYVLIIGNTLI